MTEYTPPEEHHEATDNGEGDPPRPYEHIIELVQQAASREELKEAIDKLHDADVPELLEHLEDGDLSIVMELLDLEDMVEAIDGSDEADRKTILDELPDDKLAEIIEEMPPDEAASALDTLGDSQVRAVLMRIDPEHADDIRELRQFEPETAGRIMTPEYLAISQQLSAREAIEKARESHKDEDVEILHHLLVIDSQERLIGLVKMKDLVAAEETTPVGELMDRAILCIHAERDQEVAANMMIRYDLPILPVVGDGGKLMGIITFDDIMEVLSDEAAEDMYRLAGIGADEPLSESVLSRAYKRLPWLATTLIGGLALAIIIAHFQLTLKHIVALASFIPIIMGLGGNVGIQSSTIMVRGLATGDIDMSDAFKVLRRELAVGMIIGVICATIIGIVAHMFLEFSPERAEGISSLVGFCLILSFSVLSGILMAAVIGTLAPLACHRFGVDPAIAAGPFVTVSVDICSQVIYLGVATLLLMD